MALFLPTKGETSLNFRLSKDAKDDAQKVRKRLKNKAVEQKTHTVEGPQLQQQLR